MPFITIGNLARPRGLFSSESVSDGHPGTICEQVSDAVPDAALEQEAHAHATDKAAAKGRAS